LCAFAALLPASGAMAKTKRLAQLAPKAEAEPAAPTEPRAAAPEPSFPELDIDELSAEPHQGEHAPQTLSRSEMLELAKRHDKQMAMAMVEGERAKAEAIRTRDALKLSCIQDRLARMKLTRRIAVDRLTALARDDIQLDDLRLRHEFRGVEMATDRINGLRQELSQCVGDSLDVAYGAETDKVPTTPAGDPGMTPPPDRPAPASLFQ
jgi:transcriptional antiterminator Rof (Rho-off)